MLLFSSITLRTFTPISIFMIYPRMDKTMNNKQLDISHSTYKQLIISGSIGLLAAVLVGIGEFLLHFDTLARFADGNYDFMLDITDKQQTTGHFIGVLSAPLYVIGCWHIYLMLKPANKTFAFIGFIISAYGFMVGADWISSRASIGAVIHNINIIEQATLINLYELRYESLLTVIRITTLSTSLIFIYLVLTGRSFYQKWHAFFNPIVLLIGSFVIYLVAPSIGKYIMPIALNLAYAIFFTLSLIQITQLKKRNNT